MSKCGSCGSEYGHRDDCAYVRACDLEDERDKLKGRWERAVARTEAAEARVAEVEAMQRDSQRLNTLWVERVEKAEAQVEKLQRAYDGAKQKADSHRRLLEEERAKPMAWKALYEKAEAETERLREQQRKSFAEWAKVRAVVEAAEVWHELSGTPSTARALSESVLARRAHQFHEPDAP
jgi:DNA repair exonuclease SbcCD ATPase subunit